MFSLFSGCAEWLLQREELHVLIIGLDRAGKTALLEKLKTLYAEAPGLELEKLVPTVGLNIGRFEAYGAPLVVWDLGGQVGLRSIWGRYYGECHALVFAVDATDAGRVEEARHALDRALGSRELYGAPLLVLANKQDRPGAATPGDLAEALGLSRHDGARPCSVQSVSAASGEGLRAAVQWLVEKAKGGQRAELLRRRMVGGGGG